jgi:hypothetical protein
MALQRLSEVGLQVADVPGEAVVLLVVQLVAGNGIFSALITTR